MNIETITILLRVKNSTAFATDNKFDRKKTVDCEVMVWWRVWYEEEVVERWDVDDRNTDRGRGLVKNRMRDSPILWGMCGGLTTHPKLVLVQNS